MSIQSCVLILPTPNHVIDASEVKCGICQQISRHLEIDTKNHPYLSQVHEKCRTAMKPLEDYISIKLTNIIRNEPRISNNMAAVILKLKNIISEQTLFAFMQHNKHHDGYVWFVDQALEAYHQESKRKLPAIPSKVAPKELPSTQTTSESIIEVKLITSPKYPPVPTFSPPPPPAFQDLPPLTRTQPVRLVRSAPRAVLAPQPTPDELPPPLSLGRNGAFLTQHPSSHDPEEDLWR